MNTHRRSLATLLLLLLASPAMALPWHWGVRAGVDAANLTGEFGKIVRPDLRYGLNAGRVGDAPLTHGLSLHKDMKPIDPGFAAGVGVEVAAGPGRLGVEARYIRGFSDLFDFADSATTINQVWTLALSWMR